MKPDSVVIKSIPSRFRHQVPKYKVTRSDACINCGTCANSCPYGVHERIEGHNKMRPPIDYKCIGYECRKNDEFYCVYKCPRKALSLSLNPMYETLGDCRWTSDMIVATWIMAETGYPPERTDLGYNIRQFRRRVRQAAPEISGKPDEGRAGRNLYRAQAEPQK